MAADLMPGVGDVTYSIELSSCLPYAVNRERLRQCLQGS